MELSYFAIIIGAIFVNNVVLAQFLGICPFLGVSSKVETSMGMGAAVTFVMAIAAVVAWLIQTYVLVPLDIVYMQTIVFILVIAVLVQFIEIFLKKYVVALYNSLGVYLPLITTNCCVLAVTILVVDDYGADDATQGFAAASEADLPVFGTDFDLLTTLEPAILVKIRRLPLFGLWSRLLRFPARFAGTTATEYAPLPKGLEPGALLDGFRERCAAGQSLLIVKDVPEVSPLLGAGDNEAAMRLARIAPDKGFIVVEAQALAYVPIDFSSTDEYLSRLSKSRRKNLRRKLKSRERLDIEAVPLGDARFGSLDVLEELYGLYLGVYAQSEIHFDLLTRDFFAGLLQSREIGGVVFCYRHDGELEGYNICLEHSGNLIDKYIGLRYPQARELDLYFVSWFVNLEHALERGLRFYVAGWTDPEVKAGLGARFTFTRHLVWVRTPILRRILYMFLHCFDSDAKAVCWKAADKDTDHA